MRIRHRILAFCSLLALAVSASCNGEPSSGDLFDGEPSLAAVPKALDLTFVGAVPPTTVTSLKYVQTISGEAGGGEKVEYEAVVDILDDDDGLVLMRTSYVFPKQRDRITDTQVMVAGLFELVGQSFHEQPNLVPGLPMTELLFKTLVQEITTSRGKLFPLAVGNTLEFSMARTGQAVRGTPAKGTRAGTYSYEFNCTGSQRFAGIEGELFAIQCKETHPDGFVDEFEVLFSPSLGVPVIRRRLLDGVMGTLTLVSWK